MLFFTYANNVLKYSFIIVFPNKEKNMGLKGVSYFKLFYIWKQVDRAFGKHSAYCP